MLVKFPKDDRRSTWTRHIKNKMIFYGLSESRIRRVVASPKRREEGIAEGTTAAMQPSTTRKRKEEIWVMYKKLTNNSGLKTNNKKSYAPKGLIYKSGAQLLMISAWRYPGVTKPGKKIPIPEDSLEELARYA